MGATLTRPRGPTQAGRAHAHARRRSEALADPLRAVSYGRDASRACANPSRGFPARSRRRRAHRAPHRGSGRASCSAGSRGRLPPRPRVPRARVRRGALPSERAAAPLRSGGGAIASFEASLSLHLLPQGDRGDRECAARRRGPALSGALQVRSDPSGTPGRDALPDDRPSAEVRGSREWSLAGGARSWRLRRPSRGRRVRVSTRGGGRRCRHGDLARRPLRRPARIDAEAAQAQERVS